MRDLSCMKRSAITRLIEELGLKKNDEYTQDWEYEAADAKRIGEFLEYYKKTKLNIVEKEVLMKLILESYNDYICEFGVDRAFSNELWYIFKNEQNLYKEIINYWSCENDDLEDCFAITPFIRQVREKIFVE